MCLLRWGSNLKPSHLSRGQKSSDILDLLDNIETKWHEKHESSKVAVAKIHKALVDDITTGTETLT